MDNKPNASDLTTKTYPLISWLTKTTFDDAINFYPRNCKSSLARMASEGSRNTEGYMGKMGMGAAVCIIPRFDSTNDKDPDFDVFFFPRQSTPDNEKQELWMPETMKTMDINRNAAYIGGVWYTQNYDPKKTEKGQTICSGSLVSSGSRMLIQQTRGDNPKYIMKMMPADDENGMSATNASIAKKNRENPSNYKTQNKRMKR